MITSAHSAFQLLRPIEKTAVYWKDMKISYPDLLAHSAALATLYFARPGERIMIFSENRPEWISALYSVWRNHGVVVPVDFLSPPDEMSELLRQTKPVAVFCSAKTKMG
ncbi:MAG: AMP-binding protein, partial [Verrucomicrobiota bacterium]|nr:AMP-binding protein [Verrucomicrobiota bacterium]